jgi:prevent-host-death family protein
VATYSLHEAGSNLSRLLKEVERGEEVVIARHGEPVAKLVPVLPAKRTLGSMSGIITAKRGWDAPISGEPFGL